MQVGPQPGQHSPLDASYSLQTLQQNGVPMVSKAAEKSNRTSRLPAQHPGLCWQHLGSSAVLSLCYVQVCTLTAWGHGADKWDDSWVTTTFLITLPRNGRFKTRRKFQTALTHRLGFFKTGMITAILRQAGTTDGCEDSLATCNMCCRTQSSTADSFSRQVGDKVQHAQHTSRVLDQLAQISRCHIGEAVNSGHCRREWLLHQRRQLLLDVMHSGVDSSHLAVEELHNVVGQLLFTVMGWQRPSGYVGQKTVDHFVRVTRRYWGDGGSKVVLLCTVDEPHNLLLLSGIQLSADLKVGLEPPVLTLSPQLTCLMNDVTVPWLGNVAPDGAHLHWGTLLQDRGQRQWNCGSAGQPLPLQSLHHRQWALSWGPKRSWRDQYSSPFGRALSWHPAPVWPSAAGRWHGYQTCTWATLHILQWCITLAPDGKIQDVSIPANWLGDVPCHACCPQQVSKGFAHAYHSSYQSADWNHPQSASSLTASIAQSAWPPFPQGTASLWVFSCSKVAVYTLSPCANWHNP